MQTNGSSITARITSAVALAALVLALTALIVHQRWIRAASREHQTSVMAGWADLGARWIGEAATSDDDASSLATRAAIDQFRRWSWSVLDDSKALLTALVAADGTVLATLPSTVSVAGLDGVLADRARTPQSLRIGGVQREVYVVARPVPSESDGTPWGRVVVIAAADPLPVRWHCVTAFAAPLLVVAAVSVCAIGRWVRNHVGRPLSRMATCRDPSDESWLAALPADRNDELGTIARHIRELADRAQRAAAKTEAIEKNLHTTVADRTKRIERMLQQAQKRAWLDPLTRLHNRRFLDEKFAELVEEQKASGQDLSLVMFDIDHFKLLNDTLGHAAGDELLAFTGDLLQASLRGTDLAVRYGGDEFLVILLGTSASEATTLAERLVRLFAQRAALTNVTPHPSMSAGVASIIADSAHSADALIRRADAALYRAKRGGKNAVQTAQSPRKL